MEIIFIILLFLACVTIVIPIAVFFGVTMTALTSTLFAIPVYLLWNGYFPEWFGIQSITLFQSWILCFVGRLITGIGGGNGINIGDSSD